ESAGATCRLVFLSARSIGMMASSSGVAVRREGHLGGHGMKTWRSWHAYCTKRYDVLIVLGITFLVFSLSGFCNMYECFTTKPRYLERWQIDEMPVALLAFSLGCIWLLQRRARELTTEMTRRQHMALALQESEGRYRTVVEGSLQGIYIHHNDF